MRFALVMVFLAIACMATVHGQPRACPDFESFLGKPNTSPEVQKFIKANHLIQCKTMLAGYTVYQNTNSPFILNYWSNQVQIVTVGLKPVENICSMYSGRLPHGLSPSDTPETVIQRLGTPSEQKELVGLISLWYGKLHLSLDFDRKSRHLADVAWFNK